MAYFIKFVSDLDAICNHGSNEIFFFGDDYLQISDRMAERVRMWCQKNLATVKLKSHGAIYDEPLELYVIRLGLVAGTKDLKSLIKEVGFACVTILSEAANVIDKKNVMTGDGNEAFDAVEEAARLRTLLLRVGGRRHTGSTSALLLDV